MPIFMEEEKVSKLEELVNQANSKEVVLSDFLKEISNEQLSDNEIAEVLEFIKIINYKFDELELLYLDPENDMDNYIPDIQEVDSWMTNKQAVLYLLFSVRINANCGMDGETAYVRRYLRMEKILQSVITEDISTSKLQSIMEDTENISIQDYPYLYSVAEVREAHINSSKNLAIENDITCMASTDYA